MGNKIWIELVHPRENPAPLKASEREAVHKAFAEEQCRLANNMLARLAKPENLPLRDTFFWSEHDRCYCYGGYYGYITLKDNGNWLNLDYLGRSE